MELPKSYAIVISAVIVVGILFAHSSLDTSDPVQETIEVENDTTGHDVRYYPEEGKASRVTGYRCSAGEGCRDIYSNMSMEKWTAFNTNDLAEERIREQIEEEFGKNATRNLYTESGPSSGYYRSGSEQPSKHNVTITYDRSLEHPFSYQELKEIVPDQVKGTVKHEGYSNTYTFSVYTEAEGTSGNHSYVIEDFEPSYKLLESRYYTINVEEDRSGVGLTANVLNMDRDENYREYSRVRNILGDVEELDNGESQISYDLVGEKRTRDIIEEYDYIRYESRYYNLSYEEPQEIAEEKISFDAKLFNGEITHYKPAKMQLELRIEADENVSISTGAPYPFKTLYAISSDSRICVGSKAYDESRHVADNLCEDGGMVNAIGLGREHRPGEVIKQNYTISHYNARETGNYLIEEWLDYRSESFVYEENENGGVVRYGIQFNLTKQE